MTPPTTTHVGENSSTPQHHPARNSKLSGFIFSLKQHLISFSQRPRIVLWIDIFKKWSEDRASQMGAALAYYSIFSIGPLLFLIITAAGLILGQDAASGQLFSQLSSYVGEDTARMIEGLVSNAGRKAEAPVGDGSSGDLVRNFKGLFSIGFAALLLTASAVVLQLKDSLNQVFNAEDKSTGIKAFLGKYLSAIIVIMGVGALVVALFAVSTSVSVLAAFFESILPVPTWVLGWSDILLSFALMSAAFMLLFKFLPDVSVSWRPALKGALLTAVFFVLGKYLIGLYLGRQGFSSTYGAAGSIILLLAWIYYSSQLFFLGAEFVYALTQPRTTARSAD